MDLETELGQESEDSRDGRADSAAMDLLKQLITLAAGVLALSATFLEKVGPLSGTLLLILAASWLSLILSVLGGIQTLSVIVKSRLNGDDGWMKGSGKKYAQTSKYGFVAGKALFGPFAFILS